MWLKAEYSGQMPKLNTPENLSSVPQVYMMGDSSNSSEGGNWWQDIIDEFPDNYSYDNYCCEGGDVCNMTSETDFEATYIPVLYSVTFVVGILGNGVLLGVLFHSRRAWSVTDTFIFHLSVADVLLLVTLPLWAAQSAEVEGWTFSSPLCKITGTVYTVRIVQWGKIKI